MLRTALMFALLTAILLAIGYLWNGISGMTTFLIISFILNFVSLWYSDKIVLGMYKAKPLPREDEPRIHEIVEKLSKKANIPKPKLYVVNNPSPNAFATGRSPRHAAVAVTSGLLKTLDYGEIEGVLSHELSHVKSRDTLTSTVAATIAGAISYIAQIGWYGMMYSDNRRGGSVILLPLIILAPISAMLIQLAISRGREYKADYDGSIVSKKPLSLASALEKIESFVKQHPMQGNVATSHLFIVNPFRADTLTHLFMTHPPVQERVKRLKELAKTL